MARNFFIFIAISLLFVACKPKQHTPPKVAEALPAAGKIVKNPTLYENLKSDDFQIDTVFTKGDSLLVDLHFSAGGCGNSQLQLVWNGSVMKSYPPRAAFKPKFTLDKSCQTHKTKLFSFDLKGFKEFSDKEFIFIIEGYKHKIRHKFAD